ncbi:MAG: cystathionine beta-lyase [Pacificimonas sp.]
MDDGSPDLKTATRLAHVGRALAAEIGVVNTPVVRASTCTFDSLAEFDARVADPDSGPYYGRRATPTMTALEDALTAIEPEAAGTRIFPSGVAAIVTAILAVARTGDHLLMADSVYEPTRNLASGLQKRMGIETEFYDPLVGAGIDKLLRDNTKVIFLESPGSLTFEIQDVPAITAIARERNVTTILDNTWATPLLFPALAHGVDIVVQSLTKFVIGHSDALLGSASATAKHWPRLKAMALRLGQTAGPDDMFLALRGLRTLTLRMRQHGDTTLAVAQAVRAHPKVARVLCPGLDGDPGHDLWQRDFAGYSSIFSLVMKGGERVGLAEIIDQLDLFGIGFSFGGFESLVLPIRPETVRSATDWAAEGPMLRIHCGLEDAVDLIADLTRGLDRYPS